MSIAHQDEVAQKFARAASGQPPSISTAQLVQMLGTAAAFFLALNALSHKWGKHLRLDIELIYVLVFLDDF